MLPVRHDLPMSVNTLAALDALIQEHAERVRCETLLPAAAIGASAPVRALHLGSTAADAPCAIIVGGVHGNERIGVEVVVAFLHSLLTQARWDALMQDLLARIRLVVVPLVNPFGFVHGLRGNAQRIDLMRNAPIDAARAHWLLGGQRLSPRLPWYRGTELAPESRALVDLVQRESAKSPLTISVDCHSGFGATNRIWFPWAHRCDPIPHLPEIYALRNLFRETFPNHVAYRIEPQCQHYMTHGDLWDYLYAESLERPHGPLLPLTLEMGSWLWVRKNPWQIFSRHGLFNPLVPHRRKRILRQHLVFLNFILSAVANRASWLPEAHQRPAVAASARAHWESHFGGCAEANNPADSDQLTV